MDSAATEPPSRNRRLATGLVAVSVALNLVLAAGVVALAVDERSRERVAERLGLATKEDVQAVAALADETADELASVSSDVDDVADRLDTLELGVGTSDLEAQIEDVASSVDSLASSIETVGGSVADIEGTIEGICSAIRLNWIYANSATEDLLNDLYGAC